jgi:acetolactate synthase-1/2/3 large subunit
MTVQLTGGEAVVAALIAQGVDLVYGLPGIQNDWLYNAFFDARDRIRVLHTRHEQGAAYMALGHAMATGKPTVYNVVPGPGLLNSTAALATAYGLNAPVLCLTGQIPSKAIGRAQGILHEIPDQLGILQSLTKWAARIEAPGDAASLVAEAFRQLRSGRPRPVGLEIPMDILEMRTAVGAPGYPLPPEYPEPDLDLIGQAARKLGAAKRPMIFVGGGAMNGSSEIRELAEMLQAPVVAYRTGRGVLDSRHYLSLVAPEAHPLWKDADVVLAVGTNLRMPLQQWGVDDDLTVIRIEVDPTAHDRIRAPDIAITARAEDALRPLIDAVARINVARASRADEMRTRKTGWNAECAFLAPQRAFLEVIREELGEDGIFVEELTQVGFSARAIYPVYHPRTYIGTGYQGTLGFGFPTALGVKVARPDVPVVSVSGDGGFMFCVQELATAVQHRIPLVSIIFNNSQYGNVQQMQRQLYGNRVIATDLVNPDFVRMAESFGAAAWRARDAAELRSAIRAGLAADVPVVIDVPVGDLPDVDRFRKQPRLRGRSDR